jgi:ribosomal protein S25
VSISQLVRDKRAEKAAADAQKRQKPNKKEEEEDKYTKRDRFIVEIFSGE